MAGILLGGPLEQARPTYGKSTAGQYAGQQKAGTNMAPPPGMADDIVSHSGYTQNAANSGINLTRGAYEGQQAARLNADLAADQMRLKSSLADKALSKITASSGGGTAPQVSYDMGGGAEAARAAAFARAKEMAGNNAQAALKSLQNVMGSRGLRGSSIEAGATADVLNAGAGRVNDYNREQLISDLDWVGDKADMQYQGGITQRGQDLNARQSMLSLIASLY